MTVTSLSCFSAVSYSCWVSFCDSGPIAAFLAILGSCHLLLIDPVSCSELLFGRPEPWLSYFSNVLDLSCKDRSGGYWFICRFLARVSDDHFPTIRTWEVLNLPFNGLPYQKNEDKLQLPKNCTDSTYGHTKKQYGPSLSAKDPDQENNNEGARPVMQVWKLYTTPMVQIPRTV